MLSQEDVNVATLREAYRLWGDTKGGSIEHWASICAEEIKFGSIIQGAEPMSYMRYYSKRDDMSVYLGAIVAHWDMLEFEAEHFVAQGDRVVMLGHSNWRSKATGKSVWTPMAHSWRFRDGLAVEYYEFLDSVRALAAAQPD